jgi:hypothetical protein
MQGMKRKTQNEKTARGGNPTILIDRNQKKLREIKKKIPREDKSNTCFADFCRISYFDTRRETCCSLDFEKKRGSENGGRVYKRHNTNPTSPNVNRTLKDETYKIGVETVCRYFESSRQKSIADRNNFNVEILAGRIEEAKRRRRKCDCVCKPKNNANQTAEG